MSQPRTAEHSKFRSAGHVHLWRLLQRLIERIGKSYTYVLTPKGPVCLFYTKSYRRIIDPLFVAAGTGPQPGGAGASVRDRLAASPKPRRSLGPSSRHPRRFGVGGNRAATDPGCQPRRPRATAELNFIRLDLQDLADTAAEEYRAQRRVA